MEDLVKKSILGDKNAYTQLMNMIKSDLYRVANARLDNIEDINGKQIKLAHRIISCRNQY